MMNETEHELALLRAALRDMKKERDALKARVNTLHDAITEAMHNIQKNNGAWIIEKMSRASLRKRGFLHEAKNIRAVYHPHGGHSCAQCTLEN